MTDNWTEEDVATYMARFRGKTKTKAGAAVSTANMESNLDLPIKKKDASETAGPRFRIHVHSKRRRLTDPDATSAKWAIDGLVKGGLLPDDSAKHVKEVTFTQEKSEVEETVIEVWEVA